MYQPNHHHPPQFVNAKALAVQEPSSLKASDWIEPRATGGEMQDGIAKAEYLRSNAQRHEDDMKKLGAKIKNHEDNLRFLKTQMDNLDESILDMQVTLGKYHSSTTPMEESENRIQTEENTIEQILQQENSAASVLCQLKLKHGSQTSHLPLTKNVLGVVANLGKVEDDNLSRLFSEYLGLETMMAIVCKTYEGVKALEAYDTEGKINESFGLHGLGPSIGRPVDGRFLVICLEDLRPYVGDFLDSDRQRKLALIKPRLPSGSPPPGFLSYAVNMINLDSANLSYLTASGHGLRETLFYSLFSRLQVYRTRGEMLSALPCISDGALSLDGGMIRSSGISYLGKRKEIEVCFPISSETSSLPMECLENENRIKTMKWEKERIMEDIHREETLLNHAKKNFELKKLDYVKFLAESSGYTSQVQSGPFSRIRARQEAIITSQDELRVKVYFTEQRQESGELQVIFIKSTLISWIIEVLSWFWSRMEEQAYRRKGESIRSS